MGERRRVLWCWIKGVVLTRKKTLKCYNDTICKRSQVTLYDKKRVLAGWLALLLPSRRTLPTQTGNQSFFF